MGEDTLCDVAPGELTLCDDVLCEVTFVEDALCEDAMGGKAIWASASRESG